MTALTEPVTVTPDDDPAWVRVRLPRALTEVAGLLPGQPVAVRLEGRNVILRRQTGDADVER